MARPRSLKPAYCLDKSSGRAYVAIDEERVYLGRHGTQQSRDEYDRVMGEWIAAGRPRATAAANHTAAGVTVSQVILGFWAHAKLQYPAPAFAEGKRPAGELGNLWDALRPLRRLYGTLPAASFGPKAFKGLREEMISMGWCRNVINRHTSRVRMVFKWAVENELVPGEVYYRLSAVGGLRRGRAEVRESDPVKPVPQVHVDAVLRHVSPQVAGMINLQLRTGMRPGEVCMMRTRDIDTAGKVWVYRPPTHKTAHHGHVREIRIGPQAQQVLKPFLKRDVAAFIFSPAEAETARRAREHEERQTPLGQGNRPGSNVAADPRRRPRERFTVNSYRRAIVRGCEKAFGLPAELREPRTEKQRAKTDMKPEAVRLRRMARLEWRQAHSWHPNQLRHNAATLLRRLYGIDAANVVLGHSTLAATQVYAEIDFAKADKIMAEVG